MKNYILIILSLCLLLSACSKSGSSTTLSSSLNTTETKLVGYWYCSMAIDSINVTTVDTAIAVGSPYVNFQDSLAANFPGTSGKAKDCIWNPSFVYAMGEVPGYWFYDEVVQQLNIYGQVFTIKTLNSTTLILKQNLGVGIKTIYFHK